VKGAAKTERLDIVLIVRGLADTRSRARDIIKRGLVTLNDVIATKPGQLVGADDQIAVAAGATDHVSRGGIKLRAALDHFTLDARGRFALDIGASTGGFTQVLLEAGAAKVYAVDVGHGQLHPSLHEHPRIVSLEGTDARKLDKSLIAEPVTAIVADVSFISLTVALPAALSLAEPGAWLVALVKPQFELGRAALGKRGIVRSDVRGEDAVDAIEAWLTATGTWRPMGRIPSPIAGGSGNREFLIAATL
jgi:23S rRNA (cytidine1920-2'-O)/16S rRNA (cytidine1409-2'-O)-methyltransferase